MPLKTIQENGTLTVEQRGSWVVRISGLPFLGLGAYLAYRILTTLLQNQNAGKPFPPVTGVLLVLFLTVLVTAAGLFLVFGGTIVRLDPGRQEILRIRHLGFFKRRKRYAASDFQFVSAEKLFLISRGSGSDSPATTKRGKWTFPVELTGKGGRRLQIALADLPNQAVEIGTKVADVLKLRLRDRTLVKPGEEPDI